MAQMSLLDVAKINASSDGFAGLVDEAAKAHPEWLLAPARTIPGTSFNSLIRTALPDDGFRAANTGKAATKPTYVNRLIQTFIVDASWRADVAIAKACVDGADSFCAQEALAHLEGAITNVCKQFYYGTASGITGAAQGHQGLINLLDATNMEVDAAGAGSDCSSIWAVKFGPRDVQWVMGEGGGLDEGDIAMQEVLDGSSNPYHAYVQSITGWLGLQVKSEQSIGRIRDVDAGKPLTDDMLSALLQKFPVGKVPDVLLMSRRSLGYLQQSRTATNPTGAPAPFPKQAFGIPIALTDSIVDTETAV
jgi:major capsid protein gp7